MLALAIRLHFKEHRFVVRFQPVVIHMFELCSAICLSCVMLCAHTHTHHVIRICGICYLRLAQHC
jgi:hypothetical protein